MSERIITLDSGQTGLFVPLDYPGVVSPRPPTHWYEEVARRIERDRVHMDRFVNDLRPFLDHPALSEIPNKEVSPERPYWENGYFSGGDARFAFAFVATMRPKIVLEVGSGHSTRFMRMAASQFSRNTRLISIDPFPRANVAALVDEAIPQSVLEIPLDRFDMLGPGDLLFHDGSHLTFNGTDTVRLFLEVLPRLRSGVVVHIHDVNLPFEYVNSFDGRGYSEQYMLAAMLLFSEQWQVVAPISYLRSRNQIADGGGSFWMVRA